MARDTEGRFIYGERTANTNGQVGTREAEHFIYNTVDGDLDGNGGNDAFDIEVLNAALTGNGQINIGRVTNNGTVNINSRSTANIRQLDKNADVKIHGTGVNLNIGEGLNERVDSGEDDLPDVYSSRGANISVRRQTLALHLDNQAVDNVTIRDARRTWADVGVGDRLNIEDVSFVELVSSTDNDEEEEFSERHNSQFSATVKNAVDGLRINLDNGVMPVADDAELAMNIRIEGNTGRMWINGANNWRQQDNDRVTLAQDFQMSILAENTRYIDLGNGEDTLVIENAAQFMTSGGALNITRRDDSFVLRSASGQEILLSNIEHIVLKGAGAQGVDVNETPEQLVNRYVHNTALNQQAPR